ncbi:MAG: TetR/AcrR family transcriptional regulator, partial [Solimonas sp.]
MAIQAQNPVARQRSTALIVAVAEHLWGTQGLDAVSLRQISVEAGFGNPATVQYHFGDREG